MYDTRLMQGATLSPMIFHSLSQAIRRYAEKQGIKIVAFLDFFLISHSEHSARDDSYLTGFMIWYRIGEGWRSDKILSVSWSRAKFMWCVGSVTSNAILYIFKVIQLHLRVSGTPFALDPRSWHLAK